MPSARRPRVTPSAVLLPLLLLAAAVGASGLALESLRRALDDVRRQGDALLTLERTLSAVKDVETGVRGYLLTGEEPFLLPYANALDSLTVARRDLRGHAAAGAVAWPDVERLSALIDQKVAQGHAQVAWRRVHGGAATGAMSAELAAGKATMDSARVLATRMAAAGRVTLERREATATRARGRTLALLAASGLLALLGGLTLRARLARDRQATDAELAAAHDAEHRAAAALRGSEQLLQVLFDASPLPLTLLDTRGHVQLWNPAAERVFGWSAAEVTGRYLANVPAGRIAEHERFRQRTLAGEVLVNVETERITRDGRTRPVSVSTAPIQDDAGAPTGIIAIYVDLSERHALEQQLRVAQRLEAVGRLAGGVAHDFNNVLTVILAVGEDLEHELAPQAALAVKAREITLAGESAARLTRQLLAVSKGHLLRPQALDLAAELARHRPVLERLAGRRIPLAVTCDAPLPTVLLDPVHVEQVLLNLVVNARDAIAGEGRITIALRRGAARADGRPDGAPRETVLLEVSDTGCGMDEATRERIFEPFFTTKGPDVGTGLGLATVYGIVTQSGGDIEVESEVGRGTTFRLRFPAQSGAEPPAAPRRPSAPAPDPVPAGPASETVLLVEDNETLRRLNAALLEEEGYSVIACASADEAEERVADGARPDLLLTDAALPGRSGPELARALRARGPELPVLLVSGFTANADDVVDLLAERHTAFLEKPFTGASLLDHVRRLLDGVRQAGSLRG